MGEILWLIGALLLGLIVGAIIGSEWQHRREVKYYNGIMKQRERERP